MIADDAFGRAALAAPIIERSLGFVFPFSFLRTHFGNMLPRRRRWLATGASPSVSFTFSSTSFSFLRDFHRETLKKQRRPFISQCVLFHLPGGGASASDANVTGCCPLRMRVDHERIANRLLLGGGHVRVVLVKLFLFVLFVFARRFLRRGSEETKQT